MGRLHQRCAVRFLARALKAIRFRRRLGDERVRLANRCKCCEQRVPCKHRQGLLRRSCLYSRRDIAEVLTDAIFKLCLPSLLRLLIHSSGVLSCRRVVPLFRYGTFALDVQPLDALAAKREEWSKEIEKVRGALAEAPSAPSRSSRI